MLFMDWGGTFVSLNLQFVS